VGFSSFLLAHVSLLSLSLFHHQHP
jgi:hypothetical protein